MEPLELVERLAARAKKESAPEVDVHRAVLVAIRERRGMSMTPLWVYAGWLTPTAAAVMLVAGRAWISLSSWMSSIYWAGSLDGFLSPLRQVMP
jgi:hypothetical protein